MDGNECVARLREVARLRAADESAFTGRIKPPRQLSFSRDGTCGLLHHRVAPLPPAIATPAARLLRIGVVSIAVMVTAIRRWPVVVPRPAILAVVLQLLLLLLRTGSVR